MRLFSKIFGSDSAIKSGMDLIANTGDALVFTDEEKSKQKIELLKAYEPFKLIQRFIVMVFCLPYVGLHTAVIIGCIFGADWGAISTMINEAFGYPVLAAVALYLGGGAIPKRYR
ncbi:hypothetical protein [Aliivibrio fischeri]|uniref:hypothetical protein n=1 Tax=Aliivibrio fischeri TaxID=668 RepID=UPI0007C4B784|nr:hypothetical protein [Aliivibrio fischeri]MBP3140836.1 hypothetical protein [Aliivibrio fischeri]MBP3155857.1 hypothetical protein [Aliivibrio fischeri]MCE7575292.1 hypothetical protein [Aliivibrio fischeri]